MSISYLESAKFSITILDLTMPIREITIFIVDLLITSLLDKACSGMPFLFSEAPGSAREYRSPRLCTLRLGSTPCEQYSKNRVGKSHKCS